MTSKERTHAELARTVDDLMQWLSVVEVGLIGMLERSNDLTIEEEQEESSTDRDDDAGDTSTHTQAVETYLSDPGDLGSTLAAAAVANSF
jgi:hypothetical protein